MSNNLQSGDGFFSLVVPSLDAIEEVTDRAKCGRYSSAIAAAWALDSTPAVPITASIGAGDDVRVFDPNLEIPYTRSWSLGFQRSLSRDMAIDIGHLANRNMNDWTDENRNELTIFENGFLDEFKLAQANPRANLAAGRGSTSRGAGRAVCPGGRSRLPRNEISRAPARESGDAPNRSVAAAIVRNRREGSAKFERRARRLRSRPGRAGAMGDSTNFARTQRAVSPRHLR